MKYNTNHNPHKSLQDTLDTIIVWVCILGVAFWALYTYIVLG
jgi:hypothetical protein